jgi:hypothetical protein
LHDDNTHMVHTARLHSHTPPATPILKHKEVRCGQWAATLLHCQLDTLLAVECIHKWAAICTVCVICVKVESAVLMVRATVGIAHAAQMACQPHRELVRCDRAVVCVVLWQSASLVAMIWEHEHAFAHRVATGGSGKARSRLGERTADVLRAATHEGRYSLDRLVHHRLESIDACVPDETGMQAERCEHQYCSVERDSLWDMLRRPPHPTSRRHHTGVGSIG